MILQFGTGNFLRAFVGLFTEELQRTGSAAPGPIIAVQSTGRARADALNLAQGRYHVAVQGWRQGALVNDTIEVGSLREALVADEDWPRVLRVAGEPDLMAIVSNTTEAGIALDERDAQPPRPGGAPHSFPAKLLACLQARFEAGQAGCWVVPCELIEANGTRLRELVLAQARKWQAEATFLDWLQRECHWPNTLVDRIVPGPPKQHPLLGQDPLLLACEPFAFWAVETERADFPFARHPAVVMRSDITPDHLRKVRILNGAHTALVAKALPLGFATVGDCLADRELSDWLERLLMEELVPCLMGRCEDPEGFARDVLDRFRNPFLEHRLASIALQHETKVRVRLRPTWEDYRQRFGQDPPLLTALLKATIPA